MVESIKKTILITGSGGLLGRALFRHLSLKPQYKIVPLRKKDCDIRDKKRTIKLFKDLKPWLVIHSAAYTDVDGCELDRNKAYEINVKGTYNIASGAKVVNSIVIYISSDYVFSGRNETPYRENDSTHPISIYGETKLQGELLLKKLIKKRIVIRTSWLFGEKKGNFIHTILKRAKEAALLEIVSDKYSSPTYVLDLAAAIGDIIDRIDNGRWQDKFYGVYHIANSGFCSWYEYAKVILKSAKIKGVKIKPIAMEEINFAAKRPKFSALDNSKYMNLTKKPLRKWQEAVRDYVSSIR